MVARELIDRLHSGKRVYGTLITSDSPRIPAVIGSAGIDFVFIDTEHIAALLFVDKLTTDVKSLRSELGDDIESARTQMPL